MGKEERAIQNHTAKLEKLEQLLAKHMQGTEKLSDSRLNKVLPGQVSAIEKAINKIDQSAAGLDNLVTDLEKVQDLLERAQSGETSAENITDVMQSEHIDYLANLYRIYAEYGGSLDASRICYSGCSAQSEVDNIIKNYRDWPSKKKLAIELLDNYKVVFDDPKKKTLLMRHKDGTDVVQLYNKFSSQMQSKIEAYLEQSVELIHDQSILLYDMIDRARADTSNESYFKYYGTIDSAAEKVIRGLSNLSRLHRELSGDNTQMDIIESTQEQYQKAKNDKAKDVIGSNRNESDVYMGDDRDSILEYVKEVFSGKSSYPLIKANITSGEWKTYTEWTLDNNVWIKKVYSVISVNVLSAQAHGYAAEHQGFLYKSKNGEFTDYEVALFAEEVPASNLLLSDNMQ